MSTAGPRKSAASDTESESGEPHLDGARDKAATGKAGSRTSTSQESESDGDSETTNRKSRRARGKEAKQEEAAVAMKMAIRLMRTEKKMLPLSFWKACG